MSKIIGHLPVEEQLKHMRRFHYDWVNGMIGKYSGTKEEKAAYRRGLLNNPELIDCYIILRILKWDTI